jgi:hypothetical protein
MSLEAVQLHLQRREVKWNTQTSLHFIKRILTGVNTKYTLQIFKSKLLWQCKKYIWLLKDFFWQMFLQYQTKNQECATKMTGIVDYVP